MPLSVHQVAHMMPDLRYTSLFKDILNGDAIPDKHIELGDFGRVSQVTVRDNPFSKFAWLFKEYEDKTKNSQQRFFNKCMRSTRAVTENAYCLLKSRWRINVTPVVRLDWGV